MRAPSKVKEKRLENYLLPHVDYETQSKLLFKLSGQMVERLGSSRSTLEDVEIVHGKDLAKFVFAQI